MLAANTDRCCRSVLLLVLVRAEALSEAASFNPSFLQAAATAKSRTSSTKRSREGMAWGSGLLDDGHLAPYETSRPGQAARTADEASHNRPA